MREQRVIALLADRLPLVQQRKDGERKRFQQRGRGLAEVVRSRKSTFALDEDRPAVGRMEPVPGAFQDEDRVVARLQLAIQRKIKRAVAARLLVDHEHGGQLVLQADDPAPLQLRQHLQRADDGRDVALVVCRAPAGHEVSRADGWKEGGYDVDMHVQRGAGDAGRGGLPVEQVEQVAPALVDLRDGARRVVRPRKTQDGSVSLGILPSRQSKRPRGAAPPGGRG